VWDIEGEVEEASDEEDDDDECENDEDERSAVPMLATRLAVPEPCLGKPSPVEPPALPPGDLASATQLQRNVLSGIGSRHLIRRRVTAD